MIVLEGSWNLLALEANLENENEVFATDSIAFVIVVCRRILVYISVGISGSEINVIL